MLSIIYPYRNRDLDRLRRSLDSLQDQSISKFEVFFVDYGSTPAVAKEVRKLCAAYSFVDYQYFPTQLQPWNKSRALNAVIKNLKTDFCFVADVDMIFHPEFIKKAIALQESEKTVYFQVGFLSKKDDPGKITLEKFGSYRKSTAEATGLSMFPVKILKKLRGFDEFYHFWGAEDTDMHVRIINAGYEVEFYDEQVLLLHQWHASYRSTEKNVLTTGLQLKGIVQLNHQHLKNAIFNKTTVVNPDGWGEFISCEEADFLLNLPVSQNINNEKKQIDALLYGELPQCFDETVKVKIVLDPFQDFLKSKIKKILGKKVPIYYSLKEINDVLLLHLIAFYRHLPYYYQVADDLKSITFAIRF